MKIITTTGFYGTGSSAVTDLLKEYNNICCKSDMEIRILHDPYGVSDLEYNLLENPNRHNTSHSIKLFKKQMEMLDHVWFVKRYSKYFNDQFMPAVNHYIESIVECKYKAAWHYDVYERGKLFYFISRLYSRFNILLHKVIGIPLDGRALVPKDEIAYLGIRDESEFLIATQNFVESLASVLNTSKKEYVMFDQLIPASNIDRYIRYVKNIRIITVDRDPRDVYLMEKEVWNGTVAPYDDIMEYCKWYKWVRDIYYNSARPKEVLDIRFEDLIYDYDNSIKRIEEHLGISSKEHVNKKEYFIPEKSEINTQLWRKFKGYDKEMEIIRYQLKEYCYDFPEDYHQKNNVNQKDLF